MCGLMLSNHTLLFALSWKYKKECQFSLSIVTMGRLAITFFELGVVKKFMQEF